MAKKPKTTDGIIPVANVKDSPARRKLALDTLRKGLSITAAAKAAGVDRNTLVTWRNKDKEFEQQMADAIDAGTDLIEDEMLRRAVDGVERPIYQQGALVGHVQEYSDTLMIHTVNGRRPEKWRKPPDQVTNTVNNVQVSVDERAALESFLDGLAKRSRPQEVPGLPAPGGDTRTVVELEVPSKT